MSATSNIDALVAQGAVAVPGTVSARLAALRTYEGFRAPSAAGEARFDELVWSTLPGCPRIEPFDAGNPGAACATVEIPLPEGGPVRARLIVPQTPDDASDGMSEGLRVPLALMFHDAGRPVRGWHHMARFAALGCAVLALDGGVVAPEEAPEALSGLVSQALALARTGFALEGVDSACVCTWGEGLGGALALLVAEAFPDRIARCAALDPFPLDDPRAPAHLDAACLAPRLTCELLLGTALMDELAPAEGQALVARRASGAARQVLYPKHAHERINDFEDEVLKFLRFD